MTTPRDEIQSILMEKAKMVHEEVKEMLDRDDEFRDFVANTVASAVTDIDYLTVTKADEIFVGSVCLRAMGGIAEQIRKRLDKR